MARTKLSRKELLEQYGVQKRKRKEKLPTYQEVQQQHLERHKNVNGNCVQCKEIIGGVERQQIYPCASLRRVNLA